MRGCLAFLVFVAILVTALGVAAVQVVLPAVVTTAVEGSPLVRGQPVQVEVETSLTGVVLHGRIDAVRITGHDLTEPNATIGAVDVTLSDVSLTDRTFAAASGTLDGLTITTGSGAAVPLQTVALSGASPTLIAEVRLTAAAATAALQARLEAAGVPVSSVALVPGGVSISVQGLSVQARLVSNGTQLLLDAGPGLPPVEIVAAPASGEWRIESVDVTTTEVRILFSIRVS